MRKLQSIRKILSLILAISICMGMLGSMTIVQAAETPIGGTTTPYIYVDADSFNYDSTTKANSTWTNKGNGPATLTVLKDNGATMTATTNTFANGESSVKLKAMRLGETLATNETTDYTFIMMVKNDGAWGTTTDSGMFFTGASGVNGMILWGITTGEYTAAYGKNVNGKSSVGYRATKDWRVIAGTVDATNGFIAYENGIPTGKGLTASNNINVVSQWGIGTNANDNRYAEFATVLIYEEKLDATEIKSISDALLTKYVGVAASSAVADVNGGSITLTVSSMPEAELAASDFLLTVGGITQAIDSVETVDGEAKVVLNLPTGVFLSKGQAVTLTSNTGIVTSCNGLIVDTNDIEGPELIPPVLESANICADGKEIVLKTDVECELKSESDFSEFVVKNGGSAIANVSAVSFKGNYIYLTLNVSLPYNLSGLVLCDANDNIISAEGAALPLENELLTWYNDSLIPQDDLDLWLESDYGVTANDSTGVLSSWKDKTGNYTFNGTVTKNNIASYTKKTKTGVNCPVIGSDMDAVKVDKSYTGDWTWIVLTKPYDLNAGSGSAAIGSLGGTIMWRVNNKEDINIQPNGQSENTVSLASQQKGLPLRMLAFSFNDKTNTYGIYSDDRTKVTRDYDDSLSIGAITQYQLGGASRNREDYAAFMVYHRELSESEIQSVYKYLYDKYLLPETEVTSAVVCDLSDEILLSANLPLSDGAQISDFTAELSGEALNITNVKADEYGNVILSVSDSINSGDSITITYNGTSLTDYRKKRVEAFTISTANSADFLLLTHDKNTTSSAWKDVTDTYSYNLKKGSFDTQEGYLTFDKDTLLQCDSSICGEQTGFAVVRIDKIGSGNKIFGDEIYADSVALSSKSLVSENKIIDYIKEDVWTLVAWNIKEIEGIEYIDFWVNNKKILDGAETDGTFSITDIGEGYFDIKSLCVYEYLIDDTKFAAIQDNIANHFLADFVIIDNLSYAVSADEISADVSFSSPAVNDLWLVAALKSNNGVLQDTVFKNISNVTAHNEKITMVYDSESEYMDMYLWRKDVITPLTDEKSFRIREINTETPTSSRTAESERTVPDFTSSLPSSMKLDIDKYSDWGVNYLNARNCLPEGWSYNASSNISEADFETILENITNVDITNTNAASFTGIKALVDIYRALTPLHKIHYKTGSYTLLNGLSGEELYAVNTALCDGVISDSFNLSGAMTQKAACELLTTLVINLELYDYNNGADTPYRTYHAKYADYNGTLTKSTVIPEDSSTAADNIAFEAIDKACVTLTSQGQYVDFKGLSPANKVIASFSIPKSNKAVSSDGSILPVDDIGTISLYKNNTKIKTVELHSLPLYAKREQGSTGEYYFIRYFAELIIDAEISNGDSLKFQIDNGDIIPVSDGFSEGISINYIRLETTDAPISCPSGYINANSYGANGEDEFDDTNALQDAIDFAHRLGKGLYIPAGTYYIGKRLSVYSDTTIKGAGMWHTVLKSTVDSSVLRGGRAGFSILGNDINISDLKIFGEGDYRRSSYTVAGISGRGRNVTIENVWIEQVSCGIWAELYDSIITSCRITNTFADGIHLPHAAQNTEISNCIVYGCGDDGIATSASVSAEKVSSGITVKNNTIGQVYWGRGIMMSGNAGSVLENNVINGIWRSCGILAWTESNYDTLSTYNLTIKENIVSNSEKMGSCKGQITIYGNRATGDAFWADADIYDNEVYKTSYMENRHNIYVADTTASRVYVEMTNNLLHDNGYRYWLQNIVVDSEISSPSTFNEGTNYISTLK